MEIIPILNRGPVFYRKNMPWFIRSIPNWRTFHFIWVLLLQTMLQWKCIIHVCIHMCNYRKDGICKIKSWKWNYSQQIHAFEMWCDITKLLFKQVPIFTVTNNVISMPISPPTFTKCFFFFFFNGKRPGREPLLSHCPFLHLWHHTWHYYFLKIPSLNSQPRDQSLKLNECQSHRSPGAGSSWLKRAACTSSQFCVQRHRVGSLKLVMVEAFIP